MSHNLLVIIENKIVDTVLRRESRIVRRFESTDAMTHSQILRHLKREGVVLEDMDIQIMDVPKPEEPIREVKVYVGQAPLGVAFYIGTVVDGVWSDFWSIPSTTTLAQLLEIMQGTKDTGRVYRTVFRWQDHRDQLTTILFQDDDGVKVFVDRMSDHTKTKLGIEV